ARYGDDAQRASTNAPISAPANKLGRKIPDCDTEGPEPSAERPNARILKQGNGKTKVTLEWIPGRFRRELKVSNIGAKSQSHAGTNRNYNHLIRSKNCHPKTADQIR